jgi:polysaccharide chain length determinant protein (PEP-CTERM system associated)
MSPIVDRILDEVRGAWRFRWVALAAAWGLCVVGWMVVLSLPNVYQASARVFVDTRTVLRPLLQGLAIDNDVDSQLNLVRQAMLGRPQLERVARETGLDLHATTPQARALLIDKLRTRISIMSGPQDRERERDRAGGGLVVISYQDSSRDMSLKVVDKLLNSFVEDALGGNREGSETAQRFLRAQIADYERRLSDAEARLADFKKRNVGLMPGGQGGDYFTRLQNEMEQVKQAQAKLGVTISRRDELQRQLQVAIPFVASPQSAGPSRAGAGQTGAAGGAGDTASRIHETQARIDELLLRFTEKHPDVIAARETLQQLQERQEQEIAAMRRGGGVAAGVATSPVYQSIQLSLNEAEVEVAALRGEINDRQGKVKELRERVDTMPEVEAEYAHLNRDYDVTRAQYSALVDRLERARLSEQADETGIVRFEVIDPPTASYFPVAPKRPLLLGVVLLLGLGGGGALAYLLHWLRPVFNNVRLLNEITGLPVLGSISMTWLDKYKAERRMHKLAFAGAAAMLVVIFAGVFLFRNAGTQLLRGLIS